MGLFNIFTPKTVEGKYKTLLSLFRRSHRTFTITRNEKCVVEFTYGVDNENKQFWSIKQDFDAEKLGAYGYYWDPSKRVIISVNTTVDGYPVKVEKVFNQSVNQTVMYNTIMQAYIAECAKAVDNLYGEEVRKEIQEEEKNEVIPIQTWSLIDFVKEFGKPKLAHCVNSKTKEPFTCVTFGEKPDMTFVAFSKKLGELSPQEIASEKNVLKVAKLSNSTYILYK